MRCLGVLWRGDMPARGWKYEELASENNLSSLSSLGGKRRGNGGRTQGKGIRGARELSALYKLYTYIYIYIHRVDRAKLPRNERPAILPSRHAIIECREYFQIIIRSSRSRFRGDVYARLLFKKVSGGQTSISFS